jgi:hypothetical protein
LRRQPGVDQFLALPNDVQVGTSSGGGRLYLRAVGQVRSSSDPHAFRG